MEQTDKNGALSETGGNGQSRRPGRPRANDSGPTARERILASASELFCRFGINAIGVDAIVEDAGTAKATLYNIFGSKEALVREVLTREGEEWRRQLFTALDRRDGSPGDKLLTIFDVLEAWFSNPKYYGCPFINAVGEHDKLDDSIRDITLMHKKSVLARIVALAGDCGIAEPEALAHEFAVIIDGAIVAALITRDPKIAGVARRSAEAVLARDMA